MSALAYAPPQVTEPPRLFAVAAPPAEPTLAAAVEGRWAELARGALADCVICGDAMEPRWSAGHGVVGGRCRSCGTSLE